MQQRSWEPAWQAALAAQEEHRQAMEELMRTPAGDKPSFRAALATGRKSREATVAFFEAFEAAEPKLR
jgi:class 3 adenylate cyclase